MPNVIEAAISDLDKCLQAYYAWAKIAYASCASLEKEDRLANALNNASADFISSHGEVLSLILGVAIDIEKDGVYKLGCRETLERLAKMVYLP